MGLFTHFSGPEAQAILLTGFFATIVAVWGIISQRRIMRRSATLTHLTQLESDRDLIYARNVFAELARNPKDLIALSDGVSPRKGRATHGQSPEDRANCCCCCPSGSDSKAEETASEPDPVDTKKVACQASGDASAEVDRKGNPLDASKLSTAQKIHAIRTVFNSNELLAIGVQMEIIDYTIFKRYAKSLYVQDWDYAAPLIFTLRKIREQPSMYHEFEEVARWLRDNNMPRRRRRLGLFF